MKQIIQWVAHTIKKHYIITYFIVAAICVLGIMKYDNYIKYKQLLEQQAQQELELEEYNKPFYIQNNVAIKKGDVINNISDLTEILNGYSEVEKMKLDVCGDIINYEIKFSDNILLNDEFKDSINMLCIYAKNLWLNLGYDINIRINILDYFDDELVIYTTEYEPVIYTIIEI